jgi:hypothetical protein
MKIYLRRVPLFLLLLSVAMIVAENGQSITPLSAAGIPGEHSKRPKSPTDSPYHKHPPKGPVPPTLDAAEFKGNARAYITYSVAARIKELLYQEPCFCPCKRSANHQSLLDCYRNIHASWCLACQKEAIFCYRQRLQGQSAKQIRKAMFKGNWRAVDVDQYLSTEISGSK